MFLFEDVDDGAVDVDDGVFFYSIMSPCICINIINSKQNRAGLNRKNKKYKQNHLFT